MRHDGGAHLTDPAGAIALGHVVSPVRQSAVRDILDELRVQWRQHRVAEETCQMAEQVLAEVMNNIVEHAHADSEAGQMSVEVWRHRRALVFRVQDNGAPMPGEALPRGELADHGDGLRDLPEGGFGWFMIRSMTRDLRYDRAQEWNRLTFRIEPDAPAPQG